MLIIMPGPDEALKDVQYGTPKGQDYELRDPGL
jgi:hypothetical protein